MNYFLDTEFDDDGTGPITLISLALVAEDGRTLYLVSDNWRPETLTAWVRENVLPHLGDGPRLSRTAMRQAVEEFIGNDPSPQFWAYFAAYDWMLFCRLWGLWSEMPSAIPKCCMDLKQWAVQLGIESAVFKAAVPQEGVSHCAIEDARWNARLWRYLHAQQAQRTPPDARAARPDAESSSAWQTHVAAYPREEFLAAFREAHTTLHRLWTDTVGKPGYDKPAWRLLDNALGRFARDAAEKVGISRSEPLL